jgi:hypothetical protein
MSVTVRCKTRSKRRVAAPSFETPRFARLLGMRRREAAAQGFPLLRASRYGFFFLAAGDFVVLVVVADVLLALPALPGVLAALDPLAAS